jgi:hypothetical protein
MAALDAVAEVAAAGPANSWSVGLPVAYRTVRRWERAEVDAGRTETFPAVLGVNAALAEVVLLGDSVLTEAARPSSTPR